MNFWNKTQTQAGQYKSRKEDKMSRMGDELEQRLSANHYLLYETVKRTLQILKAGFSCNPEIDSAEIHVEYLHGLFKSCQTELEKVVHKIEGTEVELYELKALERGKKFNSLRISF